MEPNFVFNYLEQIEGLAEDVLADRRENIELNKKRDKNREAIRQVLELSIFGESLK